MALRNFSNTATVPALSSSVTALTTSLALTTYSGWPVAPCYGTLELNTANAEIVLVTALSAGSMTVLRGQNGTSAVPHTAGATITHTAVAVDYTEANAHVNASTAVHGIAGAVVGTTDSQTLTTKTLTAPVVNNPTINASASAPGALIKAAASGGQDIAQFASSAGTVLAKVDATGNLSGPSIAVTGTATGTIPVLSKMAAGQTANGFEVQSSAAAKLFVVNASGQIIQKPSTAANTAWKYVPFSSGLHYVFQFRDTTDSSDMASLDSSGNFIGGVVALVGFPATNAISYPVDGSKFKVDVNGAVTTTSTLAVTGAVTAGSSVAATGAVTGSNLGAVSAAKVGKRTHWGAFTGNTDAAGTITVTHGAGFTPTVVVATWLGNGGGPASIIGVDVIGATTFRTRVGGITSITSVTIMYFCGE